MDIDDGSVDAIACERFGSHQGLVDHEAGREDRNIFTLAQDVGLANLKRLDHVALENGGGEARKAHVDRAVDLGNRHGGGLGFVGIRGEMCIRDRYRTTVEAILAANELKEEPTAVSGKLLLIPRRR